MRGLITTLVILALALIAGAGGLLLALTDTRPGVERSAPLSPEIIEQGRQLLQRYDPRKLPEGEAAADLPYPIVKAALAQFATKRLHARSDIRFQPDNAALRIALPIPMTAQFGVERYANIELVLKETDSLPALQALRIGSIPIPNALVAPLFAQALEKAHWQNDWARLRQIIRRVEFDEDSHSLRIAFQWNAAVQQQLVSTLLADDELNHLRNSQAQLARILSEESRRGAVPLATLLPQLLGGNDASSAKSRAALLALAAYLIDKPLGDWIPEARQWPAAPPVRLLLQQRMDTTQHFIVSAMIAAWTDTRFANAIGVFKEFQDARTASGFSFADLAADRAGARFGKLAVENPFRIKTTLAQNSKDETYLPPLNDLPEYLRESDLQRRFGNPNDPAYQAMVEEIDLRLRRGPLYR